MQLPPDLKAALESIAEKSGTAALKNAAQTVSARYRNKAGANAGIRTADEARAYLAARFPATFAAAAAVFGQITRQNPAFMPDSLLDVGAGPGTVALAALTQWPDIAAIRLLEPNPWLRDAGRGIFENLGLAHKVQWIETRLENSDLSAQTADLVVAGYMLNEMPGQVGTGDLAEKLWAAASQMLALIEPGTPDGYALILQARDRLIAGGAHLIAPCPHIFECPLKGRSWCHFSVRVERSKLHRALKEGSLGYEDEKFSYVAFGRDAAARPAHRVIGYPTGAKIVQLQLCNFDGTATTEQIPKSHPFHKQARKLDWGDAIDDFIFPSR